MGLFASGMFAKISSQIFDSSIRENPDSRFTFMDMLVLADIDGVVDMTHEAIAARTNRPIEIIRSTISELEGPDPKSRTPDNEGRRLVRLDDHRDWGWMIVNYDRFRRIASEEQRREKTRIRTRKYRENLRKSQSVTPCDAPVTHCNAGDAMQSQKQRQKQRAEAEGGLEAARTDFPEIEVPSWKEVQYECQRIGLVEWRAMDWFNEMEMCGWRDNKNREVVKWRAFLANVKSWWERDGRPMSPPKGKYVTKSPAENPRNFGMPSTAKQAGERAVAELRARGDLK